MLKVGLTGGIGSGKTTASKLFELLNIPVYYADVASRRLYETDVELQKAVKAHFGEDVYQNNKLDRVKLAAIVFSDPEKLALLNKLVHPPTIRDAEEWLKIQTTPYAIKEAALLFEAGSAGMLDYIIGVSCPKELRVKRIMARDGISREAVLNRMKNQIDETIKMRLCDFVVYNDESQLLIPQVLELHKKLLQLAHK
jgi:dephospho-CoA kinase